MNTNTNIIILVIGLIALLTFCIIGLYNKIVNSKNIVNDKWNEINKQLENKIKILSKIIEIIKEYDKQADINPLLEAKNKLSNAISIGDKINANNKTNNDLIEFYKIDNKELEKNKKYIELKQSLKEIDDKIDYSKEFYNESAKKHNDLIKKIPFNLVALIFKFKSYILFEQ